MKMLNLSRVAMLCVFCAVVLSAACARDALSDPGFKDGWINSTTLRIRAHGIAKEGVETRKERHLTARDAAVIDAQSKVLILTGKSRTTENGNGVISTEFSGIVRGGQIVQERYDDVTRTCVIIFEINIPKP